MYTSMGRGRKGLIEQSQKKPKKTVQMKEGSNWRKFYEVPDKNNTVFLSKDFLEALERMEPKEVVDILFK